MSLLDRLEERIMRDPNSGCWIWTGNLNRYGYGTYKLKGKNWQAHRLVYEAYVCAIPTGLVIDHLCRNRCCVSPHHLEPVTQEENNRRAALFQRAEPIRFDRNFCKYGHELTPSNLKVKITGQRVCLICVRGAEKKRRARMRDYREEIRKATLTTETTANTKTVFVFTDIKGRRVLARPLM